MRYVAVNIAMEAIIFNRVGDFGILVLIVCGLLFRVRSRIDNYFRSNLFVLLLLVGVIAKSSQVFFHSWLPNAMEGPTPVSSLLHSSTMVVAGVYLMLRLVKFYEYSYLVLLVGIFTILLGGVYSLCQHDFKKIVAYSTTSQLRFMFVIIGLNLRQVCLLYVCLHAFFKAMLFLISGAFIHGCNSIQDIRFIKFSSFININYTYLFLLRSLVIMRFPFMSAFYMKDFIISFVSVSWMNSFVFFLIIMGIMSTCFYSFRVVFYILSSVFSSVSKINGIEYLPMLYYYYRLLLLAVVSGILVYFGYGPFMEFISFYLDKIKPIIFIIIAFSLIILVNNHTRYSFWYFREYLLLYNPVVFKFVGKYYDLHTQLVLFVDVALLEWAIPGFMKTSTIKVFSPLLYISGLSVLLVVLICGFNLIFY